MLDTLRKLLESISCDYADARYHRRESLVISVAKGELEEAASSEISGVGIRVLKNGAWGFASVNSTADDDLRRALESAERSAIISSRSRRQRVEGLADAKLASGRFVTEERKPLSDISIEDKMKMVFETERRMREKSPDIVSASCSYAELIDEKCFVSTDGAEFELRSSKPSIRAVAVCMSGSESVVGMDAIGVTGGWGELFAKRDNLEIADRAAAQAIRLLSASHIKGGRETVILNPGLVGLISHEAIGHTVEADLVKSGSPVADKIGKKIVSELVTLVDSGKSEIVPGAAGTIPVDDEGVITGKTTIIERGVVKSFLLDRENAFLFGMEPTGNARAFEYTDEPIVRMRNTYIEPGDWKLDEIIADTKEGYLLMGALNGEADSNAEFMFAVQEAREVKDGELGKTYRGVVISGNAFEVLSTVDAISDDFEWDMGFGHCGKGQLAKVDGGGGYVRCKALLGGR